MNIQADLEKQFLEMFDRFEESARFPDLKVTIVVESEQEGPKAPPELPPGEKPPPSSRNRGPQGYGSSVYSQFQQMTRPAEAPPSNVELEFIEPASYDNQTEGNKLKIQRMAEEKAKEAATIAVARMFGKEI